LEIAGLAIVIVHQFFYKVFRKDMLAFLRSLSNYKSKRVRNRKARGKYRVLSYSGIVILVGSSLLQILILRIVVPRLV
jgi:predicted membrane channel-forming protein YqfA (hemolysin III family)